MDATKPTDSGVLKPESDREAPSDKPAETALDLDDLIERHERVDWRDVPGISPSEAATWSARLIEARDELEEGI